MGLLAIRHAPRELLAHFKWRGFAPNLRNAFSRPFLLCQRNQKHLRM
jgi:hypothetical protein